MSAQDVVKSSIGKKKITIFSKSYCPYCTRAKTQINKFVDELSESEKEQVEVVVLELDNRKDGSAIQDYLEETTGQRTVPNIYIGEKRIGGSSDLAPYTNAKIRETLFAV